MMLADSHLDLYSNLLRIIYLISEAQEEQSDQTSAGDEEEATVTQVTRRPVNLIQWRLGPRQLVGHRFHQLQLISD